MLAGAGCAGEHPAGRPGPSPWAADYRYAGASAHAPRYEDKALWPLLTGREYFLAARLPPTRSLAWSRPGTSGSAAGLDPYDPAHWTDLATGGPAEAPLDRTCDLVIPAAETPYTVDFERWVPGVRRRDRLHARSITVERNATLILANVDLDGHMWIQRGGKLIVEVFLTCKGSEHTFFRDDNPTIAVAAHARGNDPGDAIQFLHVNKDSPAASTEFLGMVHAVDDIMVRSGTMIVGSDSVMEPGRESAPIIDKGGRIALMDGAYFGKWTQDIHFPDLDIRGGSLLGGLPDRPISRPATVRIGRKHVGTPAYAQPIDSTGHNLDQRFLRKHPGIILRQGGTIRSFAADPAIAHLLIAPLPDTYGITFLRPPRGTPEFALKAADPVTAAFFAWLDALPQGIDLSIAAETTVAGVRFDGVRREGLMLDNPRMAELWQHVSYGPGNHGTPEQLISAWPRPDGP